MPPSTEYNKMMMMIDEKHEIGHPTQHVKYFLPSDFEAWHGEKSHLSLVLSGDGAEAHHVSLIVNHFPATFQVPECLLMSRLILMRGLYGMGNWVI